MARRIQFTVGDQTFAEIEELVNSLKTEPKKFYGEAISLMLWFAEQKRLGRAVGSLDDDENGKFREIVTPLLNEIKPAL